MKVKVTVYVEPETFIELQGLAKLARRPVSEVIRDFIGGGIKASKNQRSLDEFSRRWA